MTPEEQAIKLVWKMYDSYPDNGVVFFLGKDESFVVAKKSALICVDYIIKYTRPDDGIVYWEEVKREIEKI